MCEMHTSGYELAGIALSNQAIGLTIALLGVAVLVLAGGMYVRIRSAAIEAEKLAMATHDAEDDDDTEGR